MRSLVAIACLVGATLSAVSFGVSWLAGGVPKAPAFAIEGPAGSAGTSSDPALAGLQAAAAAGAADALIVLRLIEMDRQEWVSGGAAALQRLESAAVRSN